MSFQYAIFLLILMPGQIFSAERLEERTLQVGELERRYLVHKPKNFDPDKKLPVVLVFHGGASNPEVMAEYSGMNQKADDAGFVVVYPAGTGRLPNALTWNAGDCCGYAQRNNVDDVEFVRQLLIDLGKLMSIDKRRIYATGISNGGMISYRLASELSSQIAAIAPVGGPMGTKECHPDRPVSVMHFHGTDDKYAPYNGGKGEKSLTQFDFLSVEHSIEAWVAANGCKTTPEIEALPDTADDDMTVRRHRYTGGKQGSEVILIEIIGGGHTWPGRQARLRFLGPSTEDISANDLMWEFFEKHPLPE
ncbi:MAG: alpha/beta hydrolase family esterase [Planctomycetaceae bacterium]